MWALINLAEDRVQLQAVREHIHELLDCMKGGEYLHQMCRGCLIGKDSAV